MGQLFTRESIVIDPCFKNLPLDIVLNEILPYTPSNLNQVSKAFHTAGYKLRVDEFLELTIRSCAEVESRPMWITYDYKNCENLRRAMKLFVHSAITRNTELFNRILNNKYVSEILLPHININCQYILIKYEALITIALFGTSEMVSSVFPYIDYPNWRRKVILIHAVSNDFNMNTFVELFRHCFVSIPSFGRPRELNLLLFLFGDIEHYNNENINDNRSIVLKDVIKDCVDYRLIYEESYNEYKECANDHSNKNFNLRLNRVAHACFVKMFRWVKYLKRASRVRISTVSTIVPNSKEILKFLNGINDALRVMPGGSFDELMDIMKIKQAETVLQ